MPSLRDFCRNKHTRLLPLILCTQPPLCTRSPQLLHLLPFLPPRWCHLVLGQNSPLRLHVIVLLILHLTHGTWLQVAWKP